MTAAKRDQASEILQESGVTITVAGIPARVRRLRIRQFLALTNVLTRGLGPLLGEVRFDWDEEEARTRVLALLALAVPTALDEFVGFVALMVEPVHERDREALTAQMVNPTIETTLDVLLGIFDQERDDLGALLGKLQTVAAQIQTLRGDLTSREK